MKLRDDIDPETTWVVSDNHFGHENIVNFCHRPLDHDQLMVAEWRKSVPDDGTLLHLGDLSYRGNSFFKNVIAPELTGARKLLIMGNHDKKSYGFYRSCGFQIVRPFAIEYGDSGYHDLSGPLPWRVSFSHYAWDPEQDGKMSRYDLRLHGHIHNNGYSREAFVPFLRQHINLSVEMTKYRPVNLQLLLEGVLLGRYPATTDEQREDVSERKGRAMKAKPEPPARSDRLAELAARNAR